MADVLRTKKYQIGLTDSDGASTLTISNPKSGITKTEVDAFASAYGQAIGDDVTATFGRYISTYDDYTFGE